MGHSDALATSPAHLLAGRVRSGAQAGGAGSRGQPLRRRRQRREVASLVLACNSISCLLALNSPQSMDTHAVASVQWVLIGPCSSPSTGWGAAVRGLPQGGAWRVSWAAGHQRCGSALWLQIVTARHFHKPSKRAGDEQRSRRCVPLPPSDLGPRGAAQLPRSQAP